MNLVEILEGMRTVQEAAAIIGVSEDRVYQYIDDGRFGEKSVGKKGRTWLIDLEAVERVAAEDRNPGNPNFGKSA